MIHYRYFEHYDRSHPDSKCEVPKSVAEAGLKSGQHIIACVDPLHWVQKGVTCTGDGGTFSAEQVEVLDVNNIMADYGAIDLYDMDIDYRGMAAGVLDMLQAEEPLAEELAILKLGMVPVAILDKVAELAEQKFAKSSITRKVKPSAMREFKRAFAIALIGAAGERKLLQGMENYES